VKLKRDDEIDDPLLGELVELAHVVRRGPELVAPVESSVRVTKYFTPSPGGCRS
jgi:hypothetical protein